MDVQNQQKNWKHAKPVIGMMGAPGAGKSWVAQQFENLGCCIIDADALARDAINQPEIQKQLCEWWGGDVIGRDGLINRIAIAKHVFGNRENLEKLENLVHPMVHQLRAELRTKAFKNSQFKAVIEDCPLLLEVGLDKECDVLVYVEAPWEARLQRVTANRGWDEAELRKREKNQALLDTKRQRADYIISNDADWAYCEAQVREIASKIFPV